MPPGLMSTTLQKQYGFSRTEMMIPVEEIRRCFPALTRTHHGYPVAYFDGPGGTQVPQPVVEAMNDYLYHHNANTHWAYPSSEETDAIIDSARNVLAEFLNASPAEIVFGANMTSLTFHLARALNRGYGPDDEIVVTELDHHANIAPWRTLEKERGVRVRMVKMIPEMGELDWDDFSRQLTRHTKLVAIGAASNAIGTINDVKRAGEMAHHIGAKVFVDAVHYAPHQLIDVSDWNCDFLACSAYKFYGPPPGTTRTPTIAFTMDNVPSIEVARKLAECGVFLSHGDFYAMTVVERLGLAPDGLVRAGCACYTTTEEVDRLLTGVREL